MNETFTIVAVPDKRPERRRSGAIPIFEAVTVNVGSAVRVDLNGGDPAKRRNALTNGLSLFCSRYHHGKFSTHSAMREGALYLWVVPKESVK